MVESHPLIPWLPKHAQTLICGTFPPPRERWCMEFYYPNFNNDMWRVMGLIFYGDKNRFVDTAQKKFRVNEIHDFLLREGIALSDTGSLVERLRGNASDKYLEIIEPVDLAGLVSALPCCKNLVTTGEKAAGVVAQLTSSPIPKVGEWVLIRVVTPSGERVLRHWRMPSTSRAYPLAIERKAEYYARVLK